MTTLTAPTPVSWTDAAARGTRVERMLVAFGRLLIAAAAGSARRRAERREACPSFADLQVERMQADAVRLGVLRR